MSGTDELCMTYAWPIAGRAELARLIAAAGGLTLHESAELPAGESKSEYLSPSGTPLLKHGDLKMSQSGAIEAYLASIAPNFSGLTPQQRAIDGMYAGIKEEMNSNCAKALFTTKNGEEMSPSCWTTVGSRSWKPTFLRTASSTALPSPPSPTSRCSTSQRDTVRAAPQL